MAIGTLTAIGAGLGAAAGLAKGIGGAVAAKRSFSDEEERRLQQLVRQRALGRLGLTQTEEAGMRADLGGQVSQAQAGQEQAALRGLAGGGGSARDVFLARVASQQRTAEAQRDVNREVARADAQARADQQAEIRSLAAQKAQAKAGAVSALTGGLADAALAGGQVALQRAASREAIALKEADLGFIPDDELLKQYKMSRSGPQPGDLAREFKPDWSF